MAKKFEDLTGRKYEWLTVIAYAGQDKHGHNRWLCVCECGNYKIVCTGDLKSGKVKSCGCRHITHGGSNDLLYSTHWDMMARCYNPDFISYPYYGGKGIKVCDEWHICTNFYKWAYANGYEPGLTLERLDNEGDYCPENCCWTTWEQQQNHKTNNHILTINGKTQTLTQHLKDPEINIYNLCESTVSARINEYRWTHEEAFSTPPEAKYPVYTIKGKTQTLAKHVKDPEINIHNLIRETVRDRIKAGQTPEEAFSTPSKGKRKV